MKKISALILAMILALGLAACGTANSPSGSARISADIFFIFLYLLV